MTVNPTSADLRKQKRENIATIKTREAALRSARDILQRDRTNLEAREKLLEKEQEFETCEEDRGRI